MALNAKSPGTSAETHQSRSERFLVTGALGRIGAWVVQELVRQGVEVIAFDKGDDDYRIRYLLDGSAIAQVTRVQGDIVEPQGHPRSLHAPNASSGIRRCTDCRRNEATAWIYRTYDVLG